MSNSISGFFGKYRFLSNFYPATVEYDGVVYPTVEHAYQAAKSDDHDLRARIAETRTPGETKRLAKAFPLRSGWNEVRVDLMRELVMQKFLRHKDLRDRLLATGNAELVEENSWGDRFWGVCGGEGSNELGKILMEVRTALQSAHNIAQWWKNPSGNR